MKVICIDNKNNINYSNSNINLTIGKVYTMKKDDVDNVLIFIKDDKGIFTWHFYKRFISLKEYRKNKLEKINENSMYR